MTIKLLDLYNTTAAQEWAMYDSDAATGDEMESSLVIALNKALSEILYSYSFNFRERTHVILTQPKTDSYDLPKGIIMKDDKGLYKVTLNSKTLKQTNYKENTQVGIPEEFCIKGDKIIFYPAPSEKTMITIEYITLAIGEDSDGNEIYALKNEDDVISVPEHLEELLKNAVISRAMLNSIASESDENYSAYKKQSETAYRLLVKYSKGIDEDKKIKF